MRKLRPLSSQAFALLIFGILIILFVLSIPRLSSAKSIRLVTANEGDVIGIHTAVGYSTILEFAAKPISAVLGDQDGFKLEYVGNSITLKPLSSRAKSNLFIFTEFERFNCQLTAGPSTQVDYLVRIQKPEKSYSVQRDRSGTGMQTEVTPDSLLKTEWVHRPVSYSGYILSVISVSRSRDLVPPRAVTLIEFELSSKTHTYAFQPSSVGVSQLSHFLAIESIYLDRLELTPGARPVSGKLALMSQDFNPRQPVQLVFAVPEPSTSRTHRMAVWAVSPKRRPKTASPPKAVPLVGLPSEKGQ